MRSEIDEIDWQILAFLQEDARVSWAQLAREVGLSAPSVVERVRRLEERGVIRGYRAEIDLQELGLPIEVILRVGVGDQRSCGELVTRLAELPEVLEVARVTGTDSAHARAVVPTTEALESLLDRVAALGGSTSTALVTSRHAVSAAMTRERMMAIRRRASLRPR